MVNWSLGEASLALWLVTTAISYHQCALVGVRAPVQEAAESRELGLCLR